MSLFKTQTLPCPDCGTAVDFEVVHSVNADRRPDLRDAIVDGTFQQQPCGSCGRLFRVEPELTYLDQAQGLWAAVRPAAERGAWESAEREVSALYARSFGADAGAGAQAVGEKPRPRLVYGWGALREKLVAAGAGLDDVELELFKLAVMRGKAGVMAGGLAELRLTEIDGDNLVLAWFKAGDESFIEGLSVPRALYDEIAADHADWQPLRDEVSAGPLVDLQRLI